MYKASKETSNLNIFSNISPAKNTNSDNDSLQSSPEKRKKLKVKIDNLIKVSICGINLHSFPSSSPVLIKLSSLYVYDLNSKILIR